MGDKRARSDSAEGLQAIVSDALNGAPEPPAGVSISAAVWPFWELVTTAKAKRAWTQNDLVMAAEVARCMFRLEVISQDIELHLEMRKDDLPGDASEKTLDFIALGIKESEKRADTLAKRIRILSAHLQIHAEATQGKSHKQVKQNEAHKDAHDYGEGRATDDDDLIPGLSKH